MVRSIAGILVGVEQIPPRFEAVALRYPIEPFARLNHVDVRTCSGLSRRAGRPLVRKHGEFPRTRGQDERGVEVEAVVIDSPTHRRQKGEPDRVDPLLNARCYGVRDVGQRVDVRAHAAVLIVGLGVDFVVHVAASFNIRAQT